MNFKQKTKSKKKLKLSILHCDHSLRLFGKIMTFEIFVKKKLRAYGVKSIKKQNYCIKLA